MRVICNECKKEEKIKSWEEYKKFQQKHDHACSYQLTNLPVDTLHSTR